MSISVKYGKALCSVMVLVLAVCSCAHQELEDNVKPEIIIRCISSECLSKAAIDSIGNKGIVWSGGDKIDVFVNGNTTPDLFHLYEGDGSQTGYFIGSRLGESNYSKYPYAGDDCMLDGAIYTEIPSEQFYERNSFDRNALVMAAFSNDAKSFQFTTLSSLLKVSLTGKYPINSITFTPNDKECLMSGTAIVQFSDNVPSKMIMAEEERNNSHGDRNRIMINCLGVVLDEYSATDFYFSLPPILLQGGFTIKVTTSYGDIYKSTSSNIQFQSGYLYEIPCFNVNLYGEYEPSLTLNGKGTKENPFLIGSVSDFISFQYAVNSNQKVRSSVDNFAVPSSEAYYCLEKDIDLTDLFKNGMASWTPIGNNESLPFKGDFDGKGHCIKGLRINNDEVEYYGLFGFVSGNIRNLTVDGVVSGKQVGIIAGYLLRGASINNCVSKGSATGQTASGIACVSKTATTINNCINYADIIGVTQNASGIINISSSIISNCINYGHIQCQSTSSGICNQNIGSYSDLDLFQGSIINCANYGEVSGEWRASGISTIVSGCSITSNCINYGNIIANNEAGGIACELITGYIIPVNETKFKDSRVVNCVNLGHVSSKIEQPAAICSSASNIDIGKCYCSNCYWSNNIGTSSYNGRNTYTHSDMYMLDISLFKSNTASGYTLYDNGEENYSSVLDALNAWAFEHLSNENNYCGWEIDDSQMISLSFGIPFKPTGGTDIFSVNPKSFEINYKQQSIAVSVKSDKDCVVSTVPWISEISKSVQDKGLYKLYEYTFSVDQNKSGSEREGRIEFNNGNNHSSYTSVIQSYSYCSTDYSRNGNVVCVQSATEGNGIDIVLMGDAYTDRLVSDGTYDKDMRKAIDAFFSEEPYKTFKYLFNVYYVEIVSENDAYGGDNNTALGCYFGSGTCVGGYDETCLKYARKATGKNDTKNILTVVVMNAYKYAGTCYWYRDTEGDYGSGTTVSYFPLGVSSSNQTSMRALMLHEAGGHGFAKLGDEYSYEYNGRIPENEINTYISRRTSYGWNKNVDFTSDPFSVVWSEFLTDKRYSNEGLGVFEGACTYILGAYRPSFDSIMNNNNGGFNAPSREAIYYRIHKLAYGESWQYDFEKFAEYDEINRQKTVKSPMIPYTIDGFIPHLHPPVIVETQLD